MAQGDQHRIQHLLTPPAMPSFKQLLRISDSETIFSRTCRQLFAAGVDQVSAVAHWHSEWIRACVDGRIPFLSQDDPGGSVVGAIHHYQNLWGDSVLIVLGDVVFSNQAIQIMVGQGPRTSEFFGRQEAANPVTGKVHPEIFALRIVKDHHATFLGATSEPTWRRHPDTKLHDLRMKLFGIIQFFEISDYTDDVDTEEDYVKRFPLLKQSVSEDK